MTTSPNVSTAMVRGFASGVLFMAFFGTAWAGIGIGGLLGIGEPWLPILAVLCGLILAILSMSLIRSSKKLPRRSIPTNNSHYKRVGMWFGIVFGLEALLIGAAGAIFGAIDQFDYFFSVMALIVGAHFIPLANLFRLKAYYVTGILICLFGAITLIFLPVNTSLFHHEINLWMVFPGFTIALVLWITGIIVLLGGRRLLRLGLRN